MCKKKTLFQNLTILIMSLLLMTATVALNLTPVWATTNGKTQANAVDWACARGNERWWQDVDGVYGCQCVDLILAYYDYLLGWHASGNAVDYTWNNLPSGWQRVYGNPQPGDIVVWGAGAKMGWWPLHTEYANNPYGHIGIVWRINPSGTISTIETNTLDGQNASYHERYTNNVACYIRPDFAPAVRTDYQNLGDSFNAVVLRNDIWRPIQAKGDNVILSAREVETADFHWHFERQGDGSYIITSLYNGLAVDVTGAATASGTNVGLYNQWGTDNGAQKWYVFLNAAGNAYELAPKLNLHLRLDVAGGGTTGGTNIQVYTANNTAAQSFAIYQFQGTGPSSISVTGNAQMKAGQSQQLKANVGNASRWTTVRWSSSNEAVAAVDSTGKVTAKKAGTARITATSTYNDRVAAHKDITVQAAGPLAKIQSLKLYVGGKIQQLKLPNVKGKLSYNISNPRVAKVNAKGQVTPLSPGSASITVKDAKNKKLLTANVTVYPRPAAIKSVKAVPSKTKNTLQVTWKKDPLVSGYIIRYSYNKNMSGYKTLKIPKASTAAASIGKLSSKKYVYVQMQAYSVKGGLTIPGAWSKAVRSTGKIR